jgi:malonate decarboxylase beta subunit
MSNLLQPHEADWYEASARERIAGLLDPKSFVEFLGPEQRAMSPHLAQFDLTGAFDDGIVVGRGRLDGQEVFVAAQEGRFLGGAFGEVHGAKLVGLLRAARDGAGPGGPPGGPSAVLLLLDTGGVRLQEANAGELAISEIIRAILEVRSAGIPVLALVGGRAGAFGGGGIITACCSRVVVSEHARVSVSGPEVIETNKGVEEFDSKDRALVWRVCGARTRYLTGGADRYVKGRIQDFRETAIALIPHAPPFELATLTAEQRRLAERLQRFGDCRDAPEIWRQASLPEPERIAEITDDAFLAVQRPNGADHDAR